MITISKSLKLIAEVQLFCMGIYYLARFWQLKVKAYSEQGNNFMVNVSHFHFSYLEFTFAVMIITRILRIILYLMRVYAEESEDRKTLDRYLFIVSYLI